MQRNGEKIESEVYTVSSLGSIEENEGGAIILRYIGFDSNGEEAGEATLSIAPGLSSVIMDRSGDIDGALTFMKEGGRVNCSYDMKFMTLSFTVVTRELSGEIDYERGGEIKIDYILEVSQHSAQRFAIDIKVSGEDENGKD